MIHIFISYVRSDFDFVRRLSFDLEKLGLNYWLDVEHIKEGDDARQIIRDALEDCRLLLLISSQASMDSRRVQSEYTYFLSKDKPVIPVIVDKSAELPPDLASMKTLDFNSLDYRMGLDNLRREIVLALQGIRRTTGIVIDEKLKNNTTFTLADEDVRRAVKEVRKENAKKLGLGDVTTNTLENAHFDEKTTLRIKFAPYQSTLFEQTIQIGRSYVIGRADETQNPDIDLSLFDAMEMGVSRRHAEIRAVNDHLYIADLGSKNRTYVNDEPLEEGKYRILISGDAVRLGRFSLEVEFLRDGTTLLK